jgi:hypothetical protein
MQRVDVQLEDDLTGGPADETVEFGVDGRAYEIDLSARHAADFRRQLSRFLEHARLARPAHRRRPARTLASRERSRQIRAWAEEHGFDISERGRLPRDVIKLYETEQADKSGAGRPVRRNDGRRQVASARGGTRPRRLADRAPRRAGARDSK